MKNSLLLYGLVFIISSCNQSNDLIKEQIIHSDSVAINYFKGDGTMDSVVLVKIIKNQKIVNQLSDFVSQKKSIFVKKITMILSVKNLKRKASHQSVTSNMPQSP